MTKTPGPLDPGVFESETAGRRLACRSSSDQAAIA
jgi:hypothetical protein